MKFSIDQHYSAAEHRRLIRCEDLAPEDLETLLHHIHIYLEHRGFTVKQDNQLLVQYKNKDGNYKNITTFNNEHVMNNEGILLCASDGKEVIYGDHRKHDNCSASIVVYNMLHMTGHLWQWSCEDRSSGLRYRGKEAWELGKKIYEEENEIIHLPAIIAYETEAVFLSLMNLELIYAGSGLQQQFLDRFLAHYRYYSLVDLNALVQYFNTCRFANIFELKKLAIDRLHLDYEIKSDFKLHIRKREEFQ